MAKNVLFFCAHNDDQIVGAGGTVAKYSDEGKKIITVIFSYGEKSHPWMKPEHTIKTRVREAKKGDRILGDNELIFLDLPEGKFRDKCDKEYIAGLIRKHKPEKVFLHNQDDPHPDHREVFNIVTTVMDKMKYKGDAYMFDVWTPLNIRKRNSPKMVVDITDTFDRKVRAFKQHQSQKVAIISLLWSIYFKAWINGINNGHRYAEVFFKIR